MGLTEKVPDASTLSQNRLRRFYDNDVFRQIFDPIVEQALSQGMANGRVLYTDSIHLKASANPRKAVHEQRPEGVSEYCAELNAAVKADRKQREKKQRPGNAADVKNTKISTTDPENGLMHRDNKPQGFFYLDHLTVDGKHGIITDTFVTPGNVHDKPAVYRAAETPAGAVRAGYGGAGAEGSPEKKTGIEFCDLLICVTNSMRSLLFNEITSMPARKVCQRFFRHALASTHQYRQNSIIDSTAALIHGASLSLTSIGRHLPGPAHVKNKIKRVDRLPGSPLLHNDIPLIFKILPP